MGIEFATPTQKWVGFGIENELIQRNDIVWTEEEIQVF
jgi:hypothetical protein